MKNAVNVGDKAPDFSLPKSDGETVRLSDFLGKGGVVIFFYPKDDTAGCTAEACEFRDSYTDFIEAGAQVIGICSTKTSRWQCTHSSPGADTR